LTAPLHGQLVTGLDFGGYRDGACSAGEFIQKVNKCSARYSLHQSLTERELLALHAEVKALQEQLGLSYKDAAHRLYHSEVQKLRVEDEACKTLSGIREQVEAMINENIAAKIHTADDVHRANI
jgi:hypothetical protein